MTKPKSGDKAPKEKLYTTAQVAVIADVQMSFVAVTKQLTRGPNPKGRQLCNFDDIVRVFIARDFNRNGVSMPWVGKILVATRGFTTRTTVWIEIDGDGPAIGDRSPCGFTVDYPAVVRAVKEAILAKGSKEWLPEEHRDGDDIERGAISAARIERARASLREGSGVPIEAIEEDP